MHSLNQFKEFSAVLTLVVAVVAGWIPFRQHLKTLKGKEFPRSEALASGVFLGAGLIHMLSGASSEFEKLNVHYPFAFLLAGFSFLSLLLLEHYASEVKHHETISSPAIATLAVIMLSVHSLFAGAALGLSNSITTSLLILVAIIAHKWAASFSLAVQLNKSRQPIKRQLVYFAIFAVMTPIGILLGEQVANISNHHNYIEPIFTSLAAGTFLYIGTLHGLKRSVMIERCCNLRDFSYVIAGFSLMAIVAIWT